MTSSTPDITWQGQSGRAYPYWIFPIDTTFDDKPGNYIFAKETHTGSGSWYAVYIGQTSGLRDRLSDHEKEACARRNGATHIHVHVTPGGETVRKTEEADLIAKWQPACNTVGVANG